MNITVKENDLVEGLRTAAFHALHGVALPISVSIGDSSAFDRVVEVRKVKNTWYGCKLTRGELVAVFEKRHPLFSTRLCMAADGRRAQLTEDDLLET